MPPHQQSTPQTGSDIEEASHHASRRITQEILAAPHAPSSSLLARIRPLVEACPEMAIPRQRRGGLQHTPLHVISMSNKTPEQLEVLQYLSNRYPDSVQATDRFGLLPLHYACKGSASVQVVRHLIENFPKSVQVTDKRGRLPLFHALGRASPPSLELVNCLVECYPDSLKEQDQWNGLPLHVACHTNTPICIVQYLIQKYPESVKTKSTDLERLPLHYACLANASLEVVKCLVQQYPESVWVKDHHDKLPLYYACISGSRVAITFLLQQQYARFFESNGGQWLPLHAVCADPHSSQIEVECVAEFFPESIHAKDMKGALALHWACRTLQPSDHRVIAYLVESYPESLRIADQDGCLALHWASCSCNPDSLRTIQYLVDKYPAAVELVAKTNTLPVQMAILTSKQSLDTIYYLIRECPHSIL
jgi:ankyrin repeat protein